MKYLFTLLIFFCLLTLLQAQAEEKKTGPVVSDFGAVFLIENPDYVTEVNRQYKVVFDIANTSAGPSEINPHLNTMARFLNMHAQAGVPPKNLHVACVIHNKASMDALKSEAYRKRFGMDNPNEPLLKALKEAGVHIYMCGQSIHSRGIERGELAEAVQLALSAMTILISYQADGYGVIRF